MSNCGHWLKKCLGEEFRPSAGLCMIAFGVPLIVPGITLTVVAYEDQAGFPKYGALHILGMALLSLAGVLIVLGILLNTRLRLKIVSDDVQLMESNQEQPAKDISNIYATPAFDDHQHQIGSDAAPELISELPHYSSAVNLGDESAQTHQDVNCTIADVNMNTHSDDAVQKQVVFPNRQNSTRKFSSSKSVGECSSSFDSFDSDNISSGSYILTEGPEGRKSVLGFDFTMGYAQGKDVQLFSTFKPDQGKIQAFSFDSIGGDYVADNDRAVTLPSLENPEFVENQGFVLQEICEDVLSNANIRNKMELIFSDLNRLPAETGSNQSPTCTTELSAEANSPGSRQRLHGLSSEAFTASSELLTTSSDSVKIQDVVFNENVSASNSSVFSLGRVKSVRDSALSDCEEVVGYTQDSKPLPCKTWAQSPTTNRPHSFPCGGGVTGLSTAVVRIHSLNDTYLTSLGEFSR